MLKTKFTFYRQLDYRDCGPTCLRMMAKFYGKTFSREFLRDKADNSYETIFTLNKMLLILEFSRYIL